MTALTEAVARAGLVNEDMVKELQKWGLPVGLTESDFYPDKEAAVQAIQEAIEEPGQVEVKQTDLDCLRQYLETRSEAKLHVVSGIEKATFPVSFGRTLMGEYIIPWRSNSIVELMTNGDTYLLDDKKKVYFQDVRELYFGDVKAFMVCTPSVEGADGN